MRDFRRAGIFFCLILTASPCCRVMGETGKAKPKEPAKQAVEIPPKGTPVESNDPTVRKGQEVFNSKGCVYCHGPNGIGGVKNNNAKGATIPALTRVAEGYTDEELQQKIRRGVRDVAKENPDGPTPPLYMPAWKGILTDSELQAVITFLKSLQPKQGEGF